jgi:hypothetical protein
MTQQPWLLLVYKVPPTPTANRVYVWRKLKQLGALLIHDAAWALPANDRTREQLQWLAAEIDEMQGEAMVWEGQLRTRQQEEALTRQFREQVDVEYRALLAELAQPDVEAGTIARRYQQIVLRDYLHSALGEQVRQSLLAANEGVALSRAE